MGKHDQVSAAAEEARRATGGAACRRLGPLFPCDQGGPFLLAISTPRDRRSMGAGLDEWRRHPGDRRSQFPCARTW